MVSSQPHRRFPESETPSRKELVLKAAKELFARYGYNETTFKKISDRAGVALGLLSHHFGTKEQLLVCAGLDVVDALLAKVRGAAQKAPDGLGGVRTFMSAYLEFTLDTSEDYRILINCSPYSDIKSEEGRRTMVARFGELFLELERILRRGVRDGSIREIDPETTAATIMSMLVGVARTNLLTRYGSEPLYDRTIELVERGLRP